VTFWTAHISRDREPVLLRDGFSWGAFLFGPFWLLLHRAWIPATLSFVTFFVFAFRLPASFANVLIPALLVLHGMSGNDMLAWALERRGYLLAHVLAARTEDDAMARLLTDRPDLNGTFLPHKAVR
jgi:hypothetical protein